VHNSLEVNQYIVKANLHPILFQVNRHFALDDAEALDLEWLEEQFGFCRS